MTNGVAFDLKKIKPIGKRYKPARLAKALEELRRDAPSP